MRFQGKKSLPGLISGRLSLVFEHQFDFCETINCLERYCAIAAYKTIRGIRGGMQVNLSQYSRN
jgi:hypothetical protein